MYEMCALTVLRVSDPDAYWKTNHPRLPLLEEEKKRSARASAAEAKSANLTAALVHGNRC